MIKLSRKYQGYQWFGKGSQNCDTSVFPVVVLFPFFFALPTRTAQLHIDFHRTIFQPKLSIRCTWLQLKKGLSARSAVNILKIGWAAYRNHIKDPAGGVFFKQASNPLKWIFPEENISKTGNLLFSVVPTSDGSFLAHNVRDPHLSVPPRTDEFP